MQQREVVSNANNTHNDNLFLTGGICVAIVHNSLEIVLEVACVDSLVHLRPDDNWCRLCH